MANCEIMAIVISVDGFRASNREKVAVGDWVTLGFRNAWRREEPSYRIKELSGTWGKLWVHYRPIVDLETGEYFEPPKLEESHGGRT